MGDAEFKGKTKLISQDPREIIVGDYLFHRFVFGSPDRSEQEDLQVCMCGGKEHITQINRGLTYEVVIIVDTPPEGGKVKGCVQKSICKSSGRKTALLRVRTCFYHPEHLIGMRRVCVLCRAQQTTLDTQSSACLY